MPTKLTDKGFPAKVFPLHKFCYCELIVLKTKVTFGFEFSLRTFRLIFRVEPIKLCEGLLEIGAFNVSGLLDLSEISIN